MSTEPDPPPLVSRVGGARGLTTRVALVVPRLPEWAIWVAALCIMSVGISIPIVSSGAALDEPFGSPQEFVFTVARRVPGTSIGIASVLALLVLLHRCVARRSGDAALAAARKIMLIGVSTAGLALVAWSVVRMVAISVSPSVCPRENIDAMWFTALAQLRLTGLAGSWFGFLILVAVSLACLSKLWQEADAVIEEIERERCINCGYEHALGPGRTPRCPECGYSSVNDRADAEVWHT